MGLGAIWNFSRAMGLPWFDMGHKGPVIRPRWIGGWEAPNPNVNLSMYLIHDSTVYCFSTRQWLLHLRYIFFFFFLRRYNFGEVLAFSKNSFHLDQFLTQSFQLVILRFATSFFTSSSHLFLRLPSDLVNAGDHSYTLLTMLSSGIRCTCPNQANLCALM